MRAYEDGGCVQCVGEHIAPINGTCEVEELCVDWHEDRCKRCEPGMYLSENECLPCDENCVTCEGEADFCMSCDAAQGMYLSQNECMNNSELAGICRVFITGGGCASCVTGFYRQERTCVECNETCASCLNGDSCLTCSEDYFMTVEDTCRPKTDIVGCAVKVDSALGCTVCEEGFFLDARECSKCSDLFDACATNDGTKCLSRVDDRPDG